MQSVCPSCKNQIEHEDFLFEVVCEKCKTRFNPFMQQMDVPADGIPGLTPAAAGEAHGFASAEPTQMGSSGGSAASPDNFAESNAVFQELQQFGETLEEPKTPPPAAKSAGSPTSATKSEMMVAVAADCALTTGDTLQGHSIEAYLEPVSAWSDLDAGSDNPLKPAFDAVSTAAKNQGGNGLIGLRWVLGSDGSRVLISGIAVRANKA